MNRAAIVAALGCSLMLVSIHVAMTYGGRCGFRKFWPHPFRKIWPPEGLR